MARKFPFKFDFNEDADPVDELHRLRVATAKHFKTLDAYMEYLRTVPTAKEMIAELKAEIAEKKAKATPSRKVKATPRTTAAPRKAVAARTPTRRQKTTKRLVHA